ncbi:MAG: type II toxin-antitoxin system RelE/ParE family toxin [Polyangiales bacterium]
MIVEWSEQAIEDLEGAAAWLEERNPRAARNLIEAVGERVSTIAAGGVDGRAVAIGEGVEVRRWPVGTMVIYY